jgi:hypothetical protein
MRTLVLLCSMLLGLVGPSAWAQPELSGRRVIPFAELGMGLPLNLTLPADYVEVKRFRAMGIRVFSAEDDVAQLKDDGDFKGARRAVVTVRPSASGFYDERQKLFPLESKESLDQMRSAGATNVLVRRHDARGIPIAEMTFELGDQKVYSMAIAAGSAILRISYNARSEPRAVDDRVWAVLIAGL